MYGVLYTGLVSVYIIMSVALILTLALYHVVAQWLEHFTGHQKVTGCTQM